MSRLCKYLGIIGDLSPHVNDLEDLDENEKALFDMGALIWEHAYCATAHGLVIVIDGIASAELRVRTRPPLLLNCVPLCPMVIPKIFRSQYVVV